MTMAISPVLAALRAHTRAAHCALESTLLIARPDAGKVEYARHAAAMWGWMKAVESGLWSQSWPAGLQTARRAEKSAWLEEDIAIARADGLLAGPPPVHPAVGPEACAASRFGRAYVIEGSMLGGAHLFDRLGARLSPWTLRYLQGYRSDGARLWREFLSALGDEVRTSADIDCAARAATETFVSVGRWLHARGVA
jgi:heme oxygenase